LKPGCKLPTGIVLNGEDRWDADQSLLGNSKLTAEEIERLNRAFTFALRSLRLVDRNDPLTEMVAKIVIEIGASVADPRELADSLVNKFGIL
jgi:hypothetical protein